MKQYGFFKATEFSAKQINVIYSKAKNGELIQARIKNKNTDFPIIISGKNGSGKTHILKSLQNYCQSKKVSIYIATTCPLTKGFIPKLKTYCLMQ